MMKCVMLATLLISVSCIDFVADEFKWPDWPVYRFKTWSGLIELDDDGVKRNLHYVFVESQTEDAEVATQPVILWLNGGPGCSSLLGLMQEIGPFVIDNGETEYQQNPWSWNMNAHLLILESPFGVGFSQPAPDKNYKFTDEKTGRFNYEAIRQWFDTFTYYRGRDFYIAGESYAGMYIPYTAKALLEGEKTIDQKEKIQFKGVLIGNGVLINNEKFRSQTSLKFLARRSFIDYTNQFILNHNCALQPNSASCRQAKKSLDDAIALINPYGVYSYCWGDSTLKQYKVERQSKHRFSYTPWLKLNEDDDDSSAPCIDFGPLANKLNTDEYKQALHVDMDTVWTGCSDPVYLQYTKSEGSYLILPELFQAGIKILLYSGDQDLAVSMVETYESIKQIPGVKEIKGWTPYLNIHPGKLKDQLAGWIVEYNYFRFQVIRGAGHMVPQDQRENSWFMLDNFIQGV
ncbi:unnamed protein product [Paramecium pentaurelia]|uniref:Carboxypeptidase n=1 Tax=Paramecium pentaurelia TaxID=43138 RepID=A0A8S1TUX9_9CILI|nr:unnamed protein product [Paramecium pentaurelia]